MEPIYLDNAATTRVSREVTDVIVACLREDFGNPSSAHRMGIAAASRIKRARETLAATIGDERGLAGEIVWTSGGTEADALAILGAARTRAGRGRHVVVTAIEHPAVVASAQKLEGEGFRVSIVPVSPQGLVSPDAVADAIDDETVVVACMRVNNELGTIQPVAEVAAAARRKRPIIHVHCDAVQALGKIPVDVRALDADSVAFSAHKIHGPKGAGALWLKKGARLAPLWAGGGQQAGVRSGTENVAGIAALAEAAQLATRGLAAEGARVLALRERFARAILDADLGARINGADAPRVAHILSLAFPRVPAEPLLHALEARGVYVSAGAACASRTRGASHVLKAIQLPDDVGTLRVSFSRDTTADEVDQAAAALIDEARKLRTPS